MDMRMMLLLGSALVLVGPSVAGPTTKSSTPFNINLSRMLDLVSNYNATLQAKFFVEDVSKLADEDKCGDKFFCKVHSILEVHRKSSVHEQAIFRNLDVFVKDTIKNCTELLQNMGQVATDKPITTLLESITSCIRYKNLNS